MHSFFNEDRSHSQHDFKEIEGKHCLNLEKKTRLKKIGIEINNNNK